MKALSAPKITRVHTLQRLRTVVNFASYLARKRKTIVDDMAVAQHLIDTRLSKPTTARIRDQIGRRARDHLESARYLGLLAWHRIDAKHTHFPTAWGAALSRYSLDDECPLDPEEEAIFVDRVCRFKLSNVYHLGEYSAYRSRPCLTMLYALSQASEMDIFQIGCILSSPNSDCVRHSSRLNKKIAEVVSPAFNRTYLSKLSSFDKRNISRDVMPFVDWCRQLALVTIDRETRRVKLTARGKRIVRLYSAMWPAWWNDFDYMAELTAAGLIVLDYLKERDEALAARKLLALRGKSGLFEGKVGPALVEGTGLRTKQLLDPSTRFDFSLWYDVPPSSWLAVERQIATLLGRLRKTATAKEVITDQAWALIKSLDYQFQNEANAASSMASSQLQVTAKVRTASIQHQFSSPYEGTTYLLLQQLEQPGISLSKYQGQLVDFFSDEPRWKRFVHTNPDLFLRDGFIALVECKSQNEWGPKLRLQKKVQGELELYSNLAEAVEAIGVAKYCIAVFSYEGEIDNRVRSEIESFMAKGSKKAIILTRAGLQKAAVDAQTKRKLRSLICGQKAIARPKGHIFEG